MTMSVGGQHRLDKANRQDGGGIECRRPSRKEITRHNRVKHNMNSMDPQNHSKLSSKY